MACYQKRARLFSIFLFLLTIDEGKTVDNEEITKRNSVAQSAR